MSYQGRIPVPGVVTSVRSNKRDRRLQLETLHKKRQTDLEQQEKQRRQAEEVAQILASKWATEDRNKKRLDDAVEDHREGRLPAGDSPERARSRHTDTRGRDSGPGLVEQYDGHGAATHSVGVEGRESRGLRRYTEGEATHGPKRGAQWEMPTSTDIQNRGHRDDLGGSLEVERGSRRDNVARTRSESFRGQGESAGADEDQQGSSWHSVEHGLRREKGLSGEGSAGSGERAGSSQKAKEPPPKTKLKGVFGISDSDDDRESARSEMELVAQKKRARLSQQLTEPTRGTVSERTSGSGFTGGGGGAGPPPSVAAVQMKVVQWKYGLKGRAAEMPEELRREVAQAMGVSYGR